MKRFPQLVDAGAFLDLAHEATLSSVAVISSSETWRAEPETETVGLTLLVSYPNHFS